MTEVAPRFIVTKSYNCTNDCTGTCEEDTICYRDWQLRFRTKKCKPTCDDKNNNGCVVKKEIFYYGCSSSSSSSSSEECDSSSAWLSMCDDNNDCGNPVVTKPCAPCGKK